VRILFILIGNESRSGELCGSSIRYGGVSSSGTDSSTIYVAEYLSKKNNDVVIALEKCSKKIIDNGVTYTNLNLDDVDNIEFDILITSLWFSKFDDLPIKVNKGIIYWYHLAWAYSINEISDYAIKNNIKLGTISVSNWAYRHNKEFNDILSDRVGYEIETSIIPNPVAVDIINEVLTENHNRINHKVIFHGQWSRGGDVALNTCNKLNWDDLQFKRFDYIDKINGIDKKTLFREIITSDYFIFPQLTHGKLVYKDTFSLSVAEAIGLGTLVVTYPLGALPEYFGNYCQFIDYPNGVNIDKMNTERLSEEPRLMETETIEKKIHEIESKKNEYEYIRNNGIYYINQNFNIKKIGLLWEDFLNRF
jgi:hypothetical protein